MTQWLYIFLIKRPQDKEAWPTVFSDHERAEAYPYRASDVYQVSLVEKEPTNVPDAVFKQPLQDFRLHALARKDRGSQA